MAKHIKLEDNDISLFKMAIKGTTPLKQDTVQHTPLAKHHHPIPKKQMLEINHHEFYFSDEYQPLIKQGPIRYLRENTDSYELKKLRRGDYIPEFFLDLHGLTQNETKKELAALIAACRHESVLCANVMYGHGKNILKNQTPLWLAQHPHIIAFHQAPKEFGGSAALLILVELLE